MVLVTCCHPRVRGIPGMSGLALLLLLTACAAQPSLGRPQWYGQHGPVTAQDFTATASAGQQPVEVDFEAPTTQQAEELRQRGVQLPRSSQGPADPRAHRDFVDLRVTAVGFGITAGGYLLSCEGLPLPVFVPESHVDLRLTSAQPLNAFIYPDRDTALADLEASASGGMHGRYGGPRSCRESSRAWCGRTRSQLCVLSPSRRGAGAEFWRRNSRCREPLHPLHNPLQRQHRPLRRRVHSLHHRDWSKRSLAKTRRRRCTLARACLRTPPSARRRPGNCHRTGLLAPVPLRTCRSKWTSNTWRG